MNELISIVVPVYNVKDYLYVCINSLLNQTYKKLEIILVNDGSTDGSGKICDSFSKENKNVKVIHKTNGGLSDARNIGVINSTADYVVFVDSDDYVANTFIEKLSMGFVDESVDISCCAYLRFTDGETPKIQSIEEKELILSGEECIKYCYSKDGRKIDIVAWNKMYKKSLFDKNKILYPKGKYFEDLYTTYKLFFYSNKISINTSELYFYRNRTGSIMTTPMTKEKYDNILEGLKDSLFFFENNEKKELVSLAFSMYGRTIIRTYYNSRKIKSKKIRNEIQFLLFNDYKKTYNNFKKKINISFVKKVVFTFFYYFPKIISQVIK